MRIKPALLLFAFLVLFSAFLIAFPGRAQGVPFEIVWERGTVFLTSGDSVSGLVTLTQPRDIVSVRQANGTISAFATVNVAGFEVNEERNTGNFRFRYGPLEFYRRYQTYMWNHNKEYSDFLSPAFFVVVYPGNYSLLMRESKIPASASAGGYAGMDRMRSERILQHFYLAKPNNQIVALRNPRRDLPAQFPALKNKIKAFAKDQKLDFDDPLDLARIVEFCNRSI